MCGSVLKFERDYKMRKAGHIAPLALHELPAKYEMLLTQYESWGNFFFKWAHEKSPDYKPPTQKGIDAYRAKQRR